MYFGLTQIPAQSCDRNAYLRRAAGPGIVATLLAWLGHAMGLDAMMAQPKPIPVRARSRRAQPDPYRISPLGM